MALARPKLLIAGLIIIAFEIAVLVANSPERTQAIADELVETTVVTPENEGRLVIVQGTPELADGGLITDEEANLSVAGAVFYSRTPMQKVYVLRSRQVVVDAGEDKNSPYDDVTETEYYVARDWIGADHSRDEVIDRTTVRYENPAPLPLHAFHASGDLRIGGFRILASDVSGFLTTENGWFSQDKLAQACGDYIVRSEVDLKPTTSELGRGMLSSGDDIGDVHVTFAYETLVGADPVTLVGRQRGDQLVLQPDDLTSEAEQVQAGLVGKDEFLATITSEDASSRAFGTCGLILGIVLALASLNWPELIASRHASARLPRP